MTAAVRIALVAGLAGLCFWLWTVLFPSPQKIVLKRIASLAAVATVNPGDGALTRANKVSNLIGYFSTDAEISYDIAGVGARTLSGRDEIREAAAAGFASVASLNVQFRDATAQVGPGQQTAEVVCTANVRANDGKDLGVQELCFHFRKIDGDWLITRAESVKTLQ
ncbi:MAG TPA: nuclear transport factor 2 family protein [Candidatus Acidoferrales bacterium]|nr:nuclear transport factor 2 family protein [Candidatus Acidoferrales bacterium]